MESTLRESTPEETRALLSLRAHFPFGWRSWATGTGFAFLILAFFVSMLSRRYDLDVPVQWIMISVGMAVWIVVSIPISFRLRARFGGTELAKDIEEGLVRVERYDVDQVIEMEEYEDLGLAYFIRDRDASVHFLMGQYLYDFEDDGAFPCRQVEIVRAPFSGTLLDITCSGAPVIPEKKIGFFRKELVREGRVPTDGSAVSVEWGDIEDSFS